MAAHARPDIPESSAVIVKVGTRVLTADDGRLDRARIDVLSEGLCAIAETGRPVVLVSSGAVGAGVGKLALDGRPTSIAALQAIAAIGQTDLIQAYEDSLSRRGYHAAQVLLTAGDLQSREGYLHVRNAIGQMAQYRAVPIINENDSVSVTELATTFGDNDGLAAQVSGLFTDAVLIILSDIDGLFDGPPDDPKSRLLDWVDGVGANITSMAQTHSSSNSKGGMASKLSAASLANRQGHVAVIAPGRDDRVLQKLLAGEVIGTWFNPSSVVGVRGRRRWIDSSATIEGRLVVDAGAAKAILDGGSSLLAVGIKSVSGKFGAGEVIEIVGEDGEILARGLCNYPAVEVRQIIGLASDQIAERLGHRPHECVVHRNNLVVVCSRSA
ncbi:MAG: glutamate 5-kinase [Planctomycetota bacterium]